MARESTQHKLDRVRSPRVHIPYDVEVGNAIEMKELPFVMDDFSPENVAQQVKPLRDLLELRTRLADLRGTLQGNDKLDEMLFEAVSNTEAREKLKGEIAPGKETDHE